MENDFEKRWERIKDQLRVQASGDVQPRMSSGRTLFGIKSEGERMMDEFARRIEAEQAARRRAGARACAPSGFDGCARADVDEADASDDGEAEGDGRQL